MADISADPAADIAGNISQNFGANAVTNRQLAGAQTQQVQQATQAQSMQNRLMAARMPLILSGIHDESVGAGDGSGVGGPSSNAQAGGPAPSGSAASVSDKLKEAQDRSGTADPSILDPGAIDKVLRDQYFVPAVTQQEYQKLIKSYQVDPNDQYGLGPKRVQAMIDMRKAQQTTSAQQDSRDDFDAFHAVTDAPEGQAMNVLRASHPEIYDAITRKFKDQPDADRNEEDEARLFAAHAAGAVHQYTGRNAIEGKDGVYRDEATGISIPGVEQVGLSKDQYIKLAHEAITPSVDMPDGSGGTIKVAPWKAAQLGGAKNINGPGDWMMVRASQSNLPGAASTLSANSAPKQEARKNSQGALDTVQSQHAAAPATNPSGTPKSQNGTGTARNAQGNIDPKLTDALHDENYDYHPSNNGEQYTPTIGHTPPPTVLDDMKNQTTARNQLAKDTNQGVGAASAALTMYKAAQDVLAKGNYDGGAWNAELAKYSKWLPAGWQNHMTGDYQEVAKYLGVAALQSGKGIFAKMTQMEAKMLTNELNPAPGMDPGALRDMIGKGAKMAQYSLDSAKRVPAYLHAGKDANQFNSWNQEHFPMESETQPTTAKPNAGVAPAPKFSDAQVKAYMQKHGLSDEQATRKALGL